MKDYKQVVNPNFIVFMFEVQALIQQGYVLSEQNVPCANFTYYEAELEKEFAEVVQEPVKKLGRPAK